MAVLSVSELNRTVRLILESDPLLQDVAVRGELSNVHLHSSGHIYFSLRDASASVRAVMFRSRAERLAFRPENGQDVLCQGRVSLFERDGAYQIYVDSMEPAGVGAQYLALIQLREKLEKEGLFAAERKRALPLLPRRIGVVTSPSGAAVRDIITVARRRHPGVSLLIAPVLVQGAGAPDSIVGALGELARRDDIDLVIIGRGGGSKEDLGAFNDERVVRAVASFPVPTVAAVGHEVDLTLVDFAADRRAPTPSAAAELAVPVKSELLAQVGVLAGTLLRSERLRLLRRRDTLLALTDRRVFRRPLTLIEPYQALVARLEEAMSRAAVERLLTTKGRVLAVIGRLEGLSPLATLRRGYAIVEVDGRPARRARDLAVGQRVRTTLAEGTFGSVVEDVQK